MTHSLYQIAAEHPEAFAAWKTAVDENKRLRDALETVQIAEQYNQTYISDLTAERDEAHKQLIALRRAAEDFLELRTVDARARLQNMLREPES